MAAPGICSSFSGVVLTDVGSPVPGATVIWNNQGVCTVDPDGAPDCSPPTVTGSATTGPDGGFAAVNLPADTYIVCASPPSGGNLLGSCAPAVTLANNQDLTGLLIFLQSGSLVVITVRDPLNALSANFFLPSVLVGTGAFYRATYDPNRHAYTALIIEGIPAHLFFDSLLVVQDQDGNSVPIDTAVLPFTTGVGEVSLTVSVMPDLVNAASYLPGVTSGTIATLFGSGFRDAPGIQVASGFPLPTQLSGTSVKVNGIPAPLFAVAEQGGQGQINFQVPHFPAFSGQLPAEDFTIVVDNNGKEQTFYVRNWPGQVGVFNTLVHLNGDPITASSPGRPGEQIIIYWTEINGFDFEYSPGVFVIPDGIPSPPSVPCVSYAEPQVNIGGMAADVSSCSAAPGLVGVGQLVVTVPLDLASGDYDVAVILESEEGNIVRLAVLVDSPNT